MDMAAREPAAVRANASAYMGADGEFRKEAPFDVREQDRFRLPANPPATRGPAGVIVMVLPPENGVTRALFTLQG
jgi:hypothetical protein